MRTTKPIPDHIRQAAVAVVKDGGSSAEAGRRYGVSSNSVRKWCREAGVPVARPGRQPSPQVDELVLTGRWVRDGLIMRHVPEGAL